MLLLLLACRGSGPPPVAPVDSGDSAAPDETGASPDTADTADTADSSDSGDTGPIDTGEPLPTDALHHWTGTFDAPDLRISACGGRDDGTSVLAIGPDLDGDGEPELAVGTPGHDADGADAGVVRLYRARDLTGTLDADDAHAWAEGEAAGDALGYRVQWVGDRDGDGVSDVLTSGPDQPMRLYSGSGLAAGGPRGELATIEELGGRAIPWDDVDGDGVDDWLFGLPDRGVSGTGSSRGGIAAVLDADFDDDGTVDLYDVVYDADGYGLAGTALGLLGSDHDRDGIREPVTNLGDDLVVVNSGTMLDWATWVDDGVRWRFPGRATDDLVSLGDVDGAGREDVVLRSDSEVCVALGEDSDSTDMPVTCQALASTAIAVGDDLGGDGVTELWIGTGDTVIALDGAALVAGSLTTVATVMVSGTVASLAYTDGTLLVGLDAADRWLEVPAAVVVAASDGSVATAEITGGGSGGDPSAPDWHDVDHDGVDELFFYEDRLTVFAGAGLTSGERTLCEADAIVPLGASAVVWVSDQTGDGVDDLAASAYPDTGSVALLDGAALLAGTATVVRSWASEDAALPTPNCDIDGDGLDELIGYTGGMGSQVWSGTVVGGGSPTLLGTIDGVVETCLPDLDGDGGAELLAQGWYVYTGASLTPDGDLGWRDAWVSLPADGSPAWRALLGVEDPDGDGVSALAWWRLVDGEPHVGAVSASALTDGVDADSLAFTVWSVGGPAYGSAWYESVLDVAADDPTWTVVDADGSVVAVQATDGTHTYSLVTLPTRAADDDTTAWTLTPAPDLWGTGAHAMALVWGGTDGGRPELGIVAAE